MAALAEKRLLVASYLTFSGSGWLVKYAAVGGRTPLFGLPCSRSPCSSPLSTGFPRQARASSLATCTHPSVPKVKTSAPCTAVACLDFAVPEASVDTPPIDHHPYDFDLACPRFLQTRIVLFGTPLTWRSSLLTSFCCVSSVPPELSLEPFACIELGNVVHRHCLHVVGIVVDGELYRDFSMSGAK